MFDDDAHLIHVTVPGSPDDPRLAAPDPRGVRVHRVAELHPDDVTIIDGIRVTSVARTLVDLAEVMPRDELRATFDRARRMGLLDVAAVRESAARAEWRPSLTLLGEVLDEFARSSAS